MNPIASNIDELLGHSLADLERMPTEQMVLFLTPALLDQPAMNMKELEKSVNETKIKIPKNIDMSSVTRRPSAKKGPSELKKKIKARGSLVRGKKFLDTKDFDQLCKETGFDPDLLDDPNQQTQ